MAGGWTLEDAAQLEAYNARLAAAGAAAMVARRVHGDRVHGAAMVARRSSALY